MADEMNVPFLGSIPVDPELVKACDLGKPCFVDSVTASAFSKVVQPILDLSEEPSLSASHDADLSSV